MKNILIGIGIIAVIVLIGYGINASKRPSDTMMKKETRDKEVMMMQEKMIAEEAMKKNTMMQGNSMQKDVMMKDDTVMIQKGSYVAYSEAAATQTVKTGKTILFFHASWCPTCRAADADILKNAANIPSGTTILKVDYDSSAEMKKKYGVTTQHTFVQIDSTMNTVATWRSGNTLASIIASSK